MMRTCLFYCDADREQALRTLDQLTPFSPESWDAGENLKGLTARWVRKQLIQDAKIGETFWFVDPDVLFIDDPALVVRDWEQAPKDVEFAGDRTFKLDIIGMGCSFVRVTDQVKRAMDFIDNSLWGVEDVVLSRHCERWSLLTVLDLWGLWTQPCFNFLREDSSKMLSNIRKWWPRAVAIHGDKYDVIAAQYAKLHATSTLSRPPTDVYKRDLACAEV